MEFKKLNLNVDESKVEKKILTDIVKQLFERGKFSFFSSRKGHSDGKVHSDYNVAPGVAYCEAKNTAHLDYTDHRDYTEYSEA